MNTQTIKKAFAVPLVFVLVLLVALPVTAAPPVFETWPLYDESHLSFDRSLCGFEVWDHEVATFQVKYFSDNQGNVQRIQMHVDGIDNFYNPANPNVVLSGKFVGTLVFDADWNVVSAQGVPYHITAPGYGTVMVRAGKWVVYPDSQIAGKNSLLDPKDVQQFCSILAGH